MLGRSGIRPQRATRLLILLVISLSVALTLLLSFWNTLRLGPADRDRDSDIVDKYLVVLTAVYGIFLAFVITNLWAVNDRAETLVHAESSEVIYSGMLLSGLRAEDRKVVLGNLDAYLASVLEVEWPSMRRGAVSSEIRHYGPYDSLWQSVMDLPAGGEDGDVKHRLLDAVHTIGDQRRERLDLSTDRLPFFFKVAIVAGAVATVVPLTFVRGSRWRVQLAGCVCAVGLMALLVCMVFDLSGPYSGPTQVRPEPFRLAREKLKKIAREPRFKAQGLETGPQLPRATR